MFRILFPLGCIAAIAFGVWLVAHTIKAAWEDSLHIDPSHEEWE